MKKILLLLVIPFLFSFCATPNKLANKAFHHALVGQDEMTVCSRLGPPTNTVVSSDGGILLVYEFFTKGMFVLPEKLEAGEELFRIYDEKTGTSLPLNVFPKGYISRNTSYQTKVVHLIVTFDPKGKCIGFEQDLPRETLEFYYERLKAYIPPK